MEVEVKLQPKQREGRDMLEKTPNLFYGGAKGGGKSFLQRAIHIHWITTKRNVTTALFRRHYKELKANHIDKIFAEYPGIDKHYKAKDQCIYIPETKSRMYFYHCKDKRDLEKYKGLETQLLGIDEVDSFVWQWVVRLMQTCRSSLEGINGRVLLTGNPGGRCHAWLKRVFIDREFRKNEKPDNYAFVQALLDDNKYLGKDYEDRLEAEPNEYIRNAYRLGDWEIPAGEFFSEFNPEIHIIEPLEDKVHENWFKFAGLDWGHYHPCSFGWFAVNPLTQQIILYREYMDRQKTPNQVKMDLFKHDDTRSLKWISAGQDCWLKQRDGSSSVEEKFALKDPHRLLLTKANTDRKQGWMQMRGFLQPNLTGLSEGFKSPRFLITKNCRFTIEALTRMQHKESDPKDCETINCHVEDPIGSGDDQIQMVRYALMSVPLKGSLKLQRVKKGGFYKQTRRPINWRVV